MQNRESPSEIISLAHYYERVDNGEKVEPDTLLLVPVSQWQNLQQGVELLGHHLEHLGIVSSDDERWVHP
jgi:hypothetical protein